VAGLVAWLLLRQPHLRAFLAGLVPHRYPIAFALDRQILAPRSVAVAGALFVVLGVLMLLRSRRRRGASAPHGAAHRNRLLALFVAAQGIIALAVVLNLSFYFLRSFGKPPCAVAQHEVFRRWVPQAYPHAGEFAKMVPAGARVALRAEGGTFNRYLFAALVYPVRCYHAEEADPANISADPVVARLRAERRVEYFLRYDPLSTTQPLTLRRLAGE
jgi:hypothetical protein